VLTTRTYSPRTLSVSQATSSRCREMTHLSHPSHKTRISSSHSKRPNSPSDIAPPSSVVQALQSATLSCRSRIRIASIQGTSWATSCHTCQLPLNSSIIGSIQTTLPASMSCPASSCNSNTKFWSITIWACESTLWTKRSTRSNLSSRKLCSLASLSQQLSKRRP